MATRKFTIYNGTTNKTIESSALTWGELRKDLESNGISTSNMRAFNGESNTELSVPAALISDVENPTIFLSAKKNKSGAVSSERAALYEVAREARQSERGRSWFAGYSSLSTADLKSLVARWNRSNASSSSVKSSMSSASSAPVQQAETGAIQEAVAKLEQGISLFEESLKLLKSHNCGAGVSASLRERYNNLVQQLG